MISAMHTINYLGNQQVVLLNVLEGGELWAGLWWDWNQYSEMVVEGVDCINYLLAFSV